MTAVNTVKDKRRKVLEDEEKQVKVSNRVITCHDNDVIDTRIGHNACRN